MSWQETMQTPRERCWKWALAAWLLLTPVLFYVGFQQVFSTHADYDDEGYVMLSLASVMDGHALYDETYTQYGPFFFASQSLLHNWTGLPITHDVVRVKTLFVWVLAATLLMSFTFKETRSWRLSSIIYLLAFFHLDRLCLEPGHPQEFCVLAIAFSLWISQYLMRADLTLPRRGLCIAALGGVIGATILVKLNIGVFLFVSSVLLLLLAGPRNRLTNALLYLGSAGAVFLPVLVAQSHALKGVGLALPVVCAGGMFGILAYCRRQSFESRIGFFDWFCFAMGLGITLAATIQWTLATGTSWEGLRHGLIGQHLGFKDSFFTPAPLHTGAILASLLLAAAAWYAPVRRTILLARVAVAGVLVCALLQYLPESSEPLIHGMHDRGAAGLLLGLVGPALWVALYRKRADAATPTAPSGRLPLVLLAALQPMAAYPTPGTQMAVGTLLILVTALLILRDLVEAEWHWLPRTELVVPGMACLLAATLFVRGGVITQYRNSLTPLGLTGAGWLRVEEDKAEKFQWIASKLQEESTTFVFGENACNSFYFWTEQKPPTALNPTFWPYLLREEEQYRIIAALETTPRTAVVHQPFAAPLPTDSPLLNYLDANYEPAHEFGDSQIWMRKPGSNAQFSQAQASAPGN